MCAGRADGCAECVARGGLVGGRELGAGARAVGERQRAGARRTSEGAGSWAARRLRAGRAGRARQEGVSGRGAAGRAGARGRQARGARQARWARPAWAWPGRSLCARAGPVGPGWGFVHSDSVFFWPGSTR